MVIGGGQSGAEVVERLLEQKQARKITWVTSRSNLFAMDDNPFVNESYAPSYCSSYEKLSMKDRQKIVEAERLTSDGISADLADKIYQCLYDRTLSEPMENFLQILPSTEMRRMSQLEKGWGVGLRCLLTSSEQEVAVDRVILATGYEPRRHSFIDALLENAKFDDKLPVVDSDYKVEMRAKTAGAIYLQNRTVVQHGLQSVNLSLVAYRSSRIINSVLGYEFYSSTPDQSMFTRIEGKPQEEPGEYPLFHTQERAGVM
jgi:lysine N6-hydroxylase/mycobactin lysine-N-oxygenase